MIHNHHQNTRFRSITDRLCCIVVKEIKIFFNTYFIINKSFKDLVCALSPAGVFIDSKKQCVVPFRFFDSAAGHLVTLKLFLITINLK